MPALTKKEQTDFLEEDGILMRIGVIRRGWFSISYSHMVHLCRKLHPLYPKS